VRARAAVRKVRRFRLGRVEWKRGLVRFLVCNMALAGVLTAAGLYYFYLDRNDLPDLGGFTRFEFPSIGYIYDANGRPLKEMASEARQITRYEEIPPIIRDAILAAEDKNFFSHSGIDYSVFARLMCKIKFGDLLGRLTRMGRRNVANNAAIFPQGGSTITQQLVRGYFLKTMTAQENSDQLRHSGRLPRVLSGVIGA
jgi:penicillin-binding protein 1A